VGVLPEHIVIVWSEMCSSVVLCTDAFVLGGDHKSTCDRREAAAARIWRQRPNRHRQCCADAVEARAASALRRQTRSSLAHYSPGSAAVSAHRHRCLQLRRL